MSKPTVYIESNPDEPMMEHCLAAWQGFKWNKYDVKLVPSDYFDEKKHNRTERFQQDKGSWVFRRENPVIGSIEFVKQALLYFNAPSFPVAPLNVPDELRNFTGRPIIRTTIREMVDACKNWGGELSEPMFVKPALHHKLFTGDVLHNTAQFDILYDARMKLTREQWLDTQVFTSPKIAIRSEYRIFVNRNKKIVDVRLYSGDPFVAPNKNRVEEMIAAYTRAPAAYALDVYITPGNQTFVMECNDFWALGTYGMDPIAYSVMCAQRWHQLLS